MKKQKFSILLSAVALLLFVLPGITAVNAQSSAPTISSQGVVFTQSNSATGNSIIAFTRASNGLLTFAGTYSTHGLGTGVNLGDQGSIARSQDSSWLFAVNAGSNQLSVFKVNHNTLVFASIVGSDGVSPISVTVHGDWVYVVNQGNSTKAGNIAGFRITSNGKLHLVSGSAHPLSSSGAVGPAEISFNPSGSVLVVTEKNTNLIDTYRVNSIGMASGPTTIASNGTEPFGFAFDPSGQLIVSNAASGSLSSYSVSSSGTLTVISGSIVDGGIAPCWVAVTGNGQYAFTSDAHGNTISSFSVNHNGALTLWQSTATATNLTPTDLAFGGNSRFLYVFNAGSNEIQAYEVGASGTLVFLQSIGGLQSGNVGLAAI
jgi:6-phosphogluconolactonase